MEPPSPPLGFLWRIWLAFRQNPCQIEFSESNLSKDGRLWLRIRNDSDKPVTIFDIYFYTKQPKQKAFDLELTPFVWMLSDHFEKALAPGASFEHPVDLTEFKKPLRAIKVEVTHNRSKYPETKTHFLKKQ